MYTDRKDEIRDTGLPANMDGPPPVPLAKPDLRAGGADGWCTTLQRPAAIGPLSLVFAYFRRRRSKA